MQAGAIATAAIAARVTAEAIIKIKLLMQNEQKNATKNKKSVNKKVK